MRRIVCEGCDSLMPRGIPGHVDRGTCPWCGSDELTVYRRAED